MRGLDFVGTLVLTTGLRTANELGLTRAHQGARLPAALPDRRAFALVYHATLAAIAGGSTSTRRLSMELRVTLGTAARLRLLRRPSAAST